MKVDDTVAGAGFFVVGAAVHGGLSVIPRLTTGIRGRRSFRGSSWG
jgi:hypothetical protein